MGASVPYNQSPDTEAGSGMKPVWTAMSAKRNDKCLRPFMQFLEMPLAFCGQPFEKGCPQNFIWERV